MSNNKNLSNNFEVSNVEENVLRAVYALNMCTVSVSQIIDYNDVYILEQEYDAILNNLNLEKMPKADALKSILIELLNTITFFRIQEIRKEALEQKYQRKMRNAIWSAIPNLNVIVSGDPVTMAFSLATQVGIGYMNYRKEKSNIANEQSTEKLELRITAIEQFHALRRELFTTAWELSEEYGFDDHLRLTEKQITQYNQILIDPDELRKYVRLESIQDKFEAFPPFWYFFGHTAAYIAGDKNMPLEDLEREVYKRRAKEHFSKYDYLNKFNILREDQMTASFALEYTDLLLEEENYDSDKIRELIRIAFNASGNALDVKELCAIAYLKIGDTENAGVIFKQLVNESYNTITNAKLLSRIYVSQFLNGSDYAAKFNYKTLLLRVGENNAEYLFPMPLNKIDDKQLQLEYLTTQKILLQIDYRAVINEFIWKASIRFNAVIPAPYDYNSLEEYYGCSEKAKNNRLKEIRSCFNNDDNKKDYLSKLAESGFRFKYIDLLNEFIEICEEFDLWKQAEKHDAILETIKWNVAEHRKPLQMLQKRIEEDSFSIEDYRTWQDELNFRELTGSFTNGLKDVIMLEIEKMDNMSKVEQAEYNLAIFCHKHKINLGESKRCEKNYEQETQSYLHYDILGSDGIAENERRKKFEKMKQYVKDFASDLIKNNDNETTLLLSGDNAFNSYFSNSKLQGIGFKNDTFAIIDDKTKKDKALVFTQKGLLLITKNKSRAIYRYTDVEFYRSSGQKIMCMGDSEKYSNINVDMDKLENLILNLNNVK